MPVVHPTSDAPRTTVPTIAFLLLLGIWFGFATGYAEVAYLVKQVLLRHVFIWRGRDAIWMVPFAEATLFFLVGGILALSGRAFGRPWTLKRSTAVLGALSAYSFLVLYGRLHPLAMILLALGLGALAGRIADRWPVHFRRAVRMTTPVMAVLSLLLVTGFHVKMAANERAALDALPAARPGAPNVLLLVLDTVRAAELGLYGYPKPTSPNLDRFSRLGIRFDHAIAPSSWTLPSHGSLFTGRSPWEHGADFNRALPDSFLTLAEFLSGHGYRTGGFVGNTRFVAWEMGLAQGFSHYEDYQSSALNWILSATLIERLANDRWFHAAIGARDQFGRRDATDINAAFLEWLDESDQQPFFAFLNFYDAHTPYLPDEQYTARFGVPDPEALSERYHRWLADWRTRPTNREIAQTQAAYDASIAALDAALGELFSELDQRGFMEETVIVITSDHGEHFGDHDLYEHGFSLYRPVLWVPLVVVAPGRLDQEAVVETPVSIDRVPATIADLLDLDTTSLFPGSSLVRIHTEGRSPSRTTPFSLSELRLTMKVPSWAPLARGDMRSLVVDSLHYIMTADGGEEVFNIVTDPWEERNLAPALRSSAIMDSLRSLLVTPRGRGTTKAASVRAWPRIVTNRP